MPYIDSHMHFWNRDLMPYTWLHEVPSIWHPHTPETLHEEAAADLPEKIVFVECGAPWLDEIKWIETLAAKEPRIRGMVAMVTMNAGPQTTADIAEAKKHPLVKGVRHNFEHEKDLEYCSRPAFIEGVSQLGPAGLTFDICCKHYHLPAVIDMVRRCPQTTFILDHGAKPAIKAALLDPWRDNMRTLAKLPNIVGKLSGLATEADHKNWTPDQLKPYISHLLDTFGPNRVLFGGDWPVAKLAIPYLRWLELARQSTAKFSSAEQSAIFHDNAQRVYRI